MYILAEKNIKDDKFILLLNNPLLIFIQKPKVSFKVFGF
jgi:hypothetical protein